MAIFDNNMAVGKSENLVTLHPHDLTQPFLRGCSDLAFESVNFTYFVNNVLTGFCILDERKSFMNQFFILHCFFFSFMKKEREILWLKGPLLYFLSIVFLFCVTKQLSGVLKSSACAEEQNGRFLSI